MDWFFAWLILFFSIIVIGIILILISELIEKRFGDNKFSKFFVQLGEEIIDLIRGL
jgi:hypothetical protein